jgi:hypothetical protein
MCLIRVILVCLFFCATADADVAEWSKSDQAWGAVAGVAMLSDWSTTRYASRHWSDGYYESNPLLGSAPSTSRVDMHFMILTPAIFVLADQLPEYRTFILKTVSIIELSAVGNNLHIGLQLKF